MPKIDFVILNYNDCDNSLQLAGKVAGYECTQTVVIVDNCSTDDSIAKLRAYKNDKVVLLESRDNRGYAAGNNVGLWYLYDKGSEYVAIANPDVRVAESTVKGLCEVLEQSSGGFFMASCTQLDAAGDISKLRSYWSLPSYAYELRNLFFLGRKHNYAHDKLANVTPGEVMSVEAVQGAFFVADTKMFHDLGFFDEVTFLYCEEDFLGLKAKNNGYRIAFVPEYTYHHFHATSTYKTFGLVRSKRQLYRSKLLFQETANHIGPVKRAVYRAFEIVSLAEYALYSCMVKIRAQVAGV